MKQDVRRCTKCILPETFPFIEFDSKCVCNYCNNYNETKMKPMSELEQKVSQIKSTKQGKYDCIVMFSGGRDSSYLLHYVVKELGLNPLVFTYEWGMTTPIGDINADKMCKALNVDRVVVDGNKEKKLHNVRKNVNAWLKRPRLGMIPIFTAGDKHFFVEVNKLAKKHGIDTIFIGTNPYEKTYFKSGFCGAKPYVNSERIYGLTKGGKMKMLFYYMGQFISNPRYINSSLLNSITAYFSFYHSKQTEIDIYNYIKWDEDVINELLTGKYEWELDEETPTTWRIGDGTAAFYNYIYYNVAGFTENDTLRSNQVREDVITRDEALDRAEIENRTRPNSMKWYCDRIGVDYERAVKIIDNIPKLKGN